MTAEILYMTGFLVLAHSVESILGFGATIIAFGLGAHFFPVDSLIVMLILLALVQSTFLLVRWFHYIQWDQILTFIIPVSLAGVIAGIMIRNQFNEQILKSILGVFIMLISVMEIVILLYASNAERLPLAKLPGSLLVLAGGIFHGLLAIGGPLIVYYASRKLASQQSVRGTLSVLWIILNVTMVAGFLVNNRINHEILVTTGLLLPGLIAGIIIGQLLRINDWMFKLVTYILLCGIGGMLVFT